MKFSGTNGRSGSRKSDCLVANTIKLANNFAEIMTSNGLRLKRPIFVIIFHLIGCSTTCFKMFKGS